jgi:hypothetical protein
VLGGTPRFVQGLTAVAIAVIALAITAGPATAATTRAEYVAQVDPVCQAAQAQEEAAALPVSKKLKRLHKQERMKKASRKARGRAAKREMRLLAGFYDYVVAVEHGVNAQIATIPPAIEDTSLVQVWLRARGEALVVTQRLFRALAKGQFFAAFELLIEVETKAAEASDLVRDFGFRYCSSPAGQLGF